MVARRKKRSPRKHGTGESLKFKRKRRVTDRSPEARARDKKVAKWNRQKKRRDIY